MGLEDMRLGFLPAELDSLDLSDSAQRKTVRDNWSETDMTVLVQPLA